MRTPGAVPPAPPAAPLGLLKLKVRCAEPGSPARRGRAALLPSPPPTPHPGAARETGSSGGSGPPPSRRPARSRPRAAAGSCHSPGTDPEAATGTPEPVVQNIPRGARSLRSVPGTSRAQTRALSALFFQGTGAQPPAGGSVARGNTASPEGRGGASATGAEPAHERFTVFTRARRRPDAYRT